MDTRAPKPAPWTMVLAKPALVLFTVLICLDFLLIGAHLLRALTPWFSDALFSVKTERGLAEWFQYAKWMAVTSGFVVLALRHGTPRYLAWVVMFTYLLLDDFFSLHERLGRALARSADLVTVLDMASRDVGELLVSAGAAALLFSLVALSMVRAGPEYVRHCRHAVAGVLLLAVFGVGVDMVNAAVWRGPTFAFLLAVVEEGGELLVASALVALVFTWVTQSQNEQGESLREVRR